MSESERVRSTVHHRTNINPDNSDNSDNPGRTDNFIVKFCLTLSQTLQFLCRVRAFFRRYENRSKVPKLPISCVPIRIYSKNSLLYSTLLYSLQYRVVEHPNICVGLMQISAKMLTQRRQLDMKFVLIS